jgi:hypothetical protein
MKKILLILIASILLLSCKHSANEAGVTENSKQATIDSMNVVIEQQEADLAKQKSIDYMQNIVNNQRPRQVIIHNDAPVAQVATPAPVAKKKGWSNTAKGAVIGAGTGAIGGAIINHKDRGTGALIGGLAGAGLGAGAGAIMDAQQKKKEEEQQQPTPTPTP